MADKKSCYGKCDRCIGEITVAARNGEHYEDAV